MGRLACQLTSAKSSKFFCVHIPVWPAQCAYLSRSHRHQLAASCGEDNGKPTCYSMACRHQGGPTTLQRGGAEGQGAGSISLGTCLPGWAIGMGFKSGTAMPDAQIDDPLKRRKQHENDGLAAGQVPGALSCCARAALRGASVGQDDRHPCLTE